MIRASAWSRSASLSTITAALPPSSSTTFFFPALAFRSQPTAGEPVKDRSLSRSSVVNRSAPSRVAGRIEKAPSGNMSHSASTSPMMIAPSGVIDAGFITKGQPMAIAGAILCAARFNGKLNGEMKLHGPIRSEEHTSELQSLMRISYAVFCLKKKNMKLPNQSIKLNTDNDLQHLRSQHHI